MNKVTDKLQYIGIGPSEVTGREWFNTGYDR